MANRANMTDKEIQGLKPQSKQYSRPVGGVHGLMIRVSPGGTKTFSLVGRLRGRSYRKSLGRYPDLRLKEAREKALVLRGQIATGSMDDVLLDNASKRIETFASLVELYIDNYCRPNTRDWENTQSRFRKHVIGKIGKAQPNQITRYELSALLSPLAKAGQTSTANRVHAALKGVFG